MKRCLFLLSLFATIITGCCEQEKIIVPGAKWYDTNGAIINAHGGGVTYHEGRYYWFGEHKIEGAEGNRAHVGVHCYSSDNLYDWVDEGVALAVEETNDTSKLQKGSILERPKVIYNKRTEQFVMWFHHEPIGAGYSGAMSGVAVSDKINGEYKFLKFVRPNAGYYPINVKELHKGESRAEGITFSGGDLPDHPDKLNLLGRDFTKGQMARDMNLFVDDDGTAYHIYSSEENSTLHISKLTDDYLSHSGEYIRVFEGRFMEAPAMFKRNGKYYLMMSGCSGWSPNSARSAVADSILGEWRELGDPCIGDTTQTTFHSQSTCIVNIQGTDRYIYMGDRWAPEDAIDGRYIWLPIRFEGDKFKIEWADAWTL